MPNQIVLSVNTIPDRDKAIKKLYQSLTAQPTKKYTIQKDRVNRIKIFHNKGSLRILVTTYVVIILPVLLDLSVLDQFDGEIDFRLDETIIKLETLARILRSMNGKRVTPKAFGKINLKEALANTF